jgi:hypothetical protein
MAIRRAFRSMPRNPAELDRLFRDVDLPNNEINDAQLRDSVGCSVVGRATNSTGDPADIQASTNDRLLARTSDTLDFRQLTVGMVPDDLITYAKIQNVSATDRLLGRSTAGSGNIEEITCTAAGRALLDDANASDQRTTLGLGSAATQNTGTSGANVPLLNGTNTWAGGQTFSLPPVLPSYTVATVPSAATYARGMIYVSDEAGGAVPAFSDGANWRRVTDRAIVS